MSKNVKLPYDLTWLIRQNGGSSGKVAMPCAYGSKSRKRQKIASQHSFSANLDWKKTISRHSFTSVPHTDANPLLKSIAAPYRRVVQNCSVVLEVNQA